jgi:hypothetical protein
MADETAKPLIIAQQGSFAVGGTVITNPGTFDPYRLTPEGQTLHGDHAYVFYQVPANARKLPLVLWHGGPIERRPASTQDRQHGATICVLLPLTIQNQPVVLGLGGAAERIRKNHARYLAILQRAAKTGEPAGAFDQPIDIEF